MGCGNFEVLKSKFGVNLMYLHFMGFKFAPNLHQTYIKLTLMKCKLDVNLCPWSVSLHQGFIGNRELTSKLHLQVQFSLASVSLV